MALVIGNKALQAIDTIARAEDLSKQYDSTDALLILALALAILKTPRAIREAAKRIKKDCNPGGVYVANLVLKSPDPVRMIRVCLDNLEA